MVQRFGIVAVALVCALVLTWAARGRRERAAFERLVHPRTTPVAAMPASYTEVRRIDTGLKFAHALAVGADGRLFVGGDKAVWIIDDAGARTIFFGLKGQPEALAVSDNGACFVAMRNRVEVYAPTGKKIGAWTPPGSRVYLTSVSVGAESVWVADAGNRIVYRYDRSGKLLGRVGNSLLAPSPHLDVADAGDSLLVANPGRHRVETYGADGRLRSHWGQAGMSDARFSGCCNPADFTRLPGGRIVTAEKGLRRVKVYEQDGQFAALVAGPAAFARGTEAMDLAADALGQIYVLDPVDRVIHVFAMK